MSIVTSKMIVSRSPGWVTCYLSPELDRAFCERFDRNIADIRHHREVTELVAFGTDEAQWVKPQNYAALPGHVFGSYNEMAAISNLPYPVELCFTGMQKTSTSGIRLKCTKKLAEGKVAAILLDMCATTGREQLSLWLAVPADIADRFTRDLARIRNG